MNDTSKKPPLELFTADMPTDYIATNGDEYVLKSKYQSLQAEIEHLKRMLADERSGDCDKDKTIRRLGSNYQSLLEQCEKIEKALEFYTPSKDAIFEVVDEGRNYDTYNVIYESDLSPDGKCDQPLGTKARQALEEYRKSKGDL